MIEFDVINRMTPIHRNAFLEASAGTGKTFAIENIVMRLLIESKEGCIPFLLDRILVVTFTKASTRDLKARIRKNLETVSNGLASSPEGRCLDFDYITNIIESGQATSRQIKRRIDQALFSFDTSNIFTIHGFCWRMLKNFAMEAGMSLSAMSEEQDSYTAKKLFQVVRDFIRTELTEDLYTSQQLKIVLKEMKSLEKLQDEIFSLVVKGIEILPLPYLKDLFHQFQLAMGDLKRDDHLEAEKIVSDFFLLAPAYKGLNKPKTEEVIEKFASLFNKNFWDLQDFDVLIEDGLFILDALSSENKKKKSKVNYDQLNYPNLLNRLQEKLAPVVNQARNPEAILARMASECQKLMSRYQEQEEIIGHNELLKHTLTAIQSQEFANKVRSCFDAVIIDEFQDTDPIQWNIFQTLFCDASWKGFLYLVGDPKQSIYAFRHADIYTYLSASKALGESSWGTLNTNYRSHPELVQALNGLFSKAENLFALPSKESHLTYRPVKAGKKENASFFSGSTLHFWLPKTDDKRMSQPDLEKQYYFPAIANEIIRLKQEIGIKECDCAVLVADRYEAQRLLKYLKQCNIPAQSQRGICLKNSQAVHVMRDLLKGILHYQNESRLKIALASKILGFTHTELLACQFNEKLQSFMETCHPLRQALIDKGAATFFPLLWQSIWHEDGKNVLERLLLQRDGLEFYRDWQDISDQLIEKQESHTLSAVELIHFLENIDQSEADKESSFKSTVDHEQEGVSILTTHISKGLEFEIVFALGLIKRNKKPGGLIAIENDQKTCLYLAENENAIAYLKHCEEIDAEKMRQLYVALTRAKSCVYVPIMPWGGNKSLKFGEASPIDLLLARLNSSNGNLYQDLYAQIAKEDGAALKAFVGQCDQVKLSEIPFQPTPPFLYREKNSTILHPPPDVKIPRESLFVQSFSSLSQSNAKQSTNSTAAPHEFCIEEKSIHALPAGSETGSLLHHILESISFAIAKEWQHPQEACSAIHPFLIGTPFVAWEEIVATLVFNAFKTPLPGAYGGFCLADVDPKKIYQETEFFYSNSEQEFFNAKQGFMKGVIDLFFEHNGKYYLIDWKSNWLGPSLQNYSPEELYKAMVQHHYHLQADIYSEALQKYLRVFDNRLFKALFGGAFYLFLRGISPHSGIYHYLSSKG